MFYSTCGRVTSANLAAADLILRDPRPRFELASVRTPTYSGKLVALVLLIPDSWFPILYYLISYSSFFTYHCLFIIPQSLLFMPYSSFLSLCFSFLILYSSCLIPHSLFLILYSSCLIPHSLFLISFFDLCYFPPSHSYSNVISYLFFRFPAYCQIDI